jgi:hypothetical protein
MESMGEKEDLITRIGYKSNCTRIKKYFGEKGFISYDPKTKMYRMYVY